MVVRRVRALRRRLVTLPVSLTAKLLVSLLVKLLVSLLVGSPLVLGGEKGFCCSLVLPGFLVVGGLCSVVALSAVGFEEEWKVFLPQRYLLVVLLALLDP